MAQTAPDLCLSNQALGRYSTVIEIASTVIRFLEQSQREKENFCGPTNVYSGLFVMAGLARAMLGDIEGGLASCEMGLEKAAIMGNPTTLGICEFYYASILLLKADIEKSRDHFQTSITHLEKVKFMQPLALSWSGLGMAEILSDRIEEGRRHIEKGLRIHGETGAEWNRSYHLLHLGVSGYHAKELEHARRNMEEGLQAARTSHEKHLEGKILIWLGRVQGQLDPGSGDLARATISAGMKVLDDLETMPDLSLGYFFLGELECRLGCHAEGLAHLTRAQGQFQEMGMEYWAKRVRERLPKTYQYRH
ncbi:MAG: hypothetical protein JRJ85_14880 [Deltaproteobacteria bacterium]|nr:hypothetical protein [Deltaproteobacteria bacterium]